MLHSVEFGGGPPILILHGGGLDHQHMVDALEPVFQDAPDWRRIYADLPGHGRSTGDGIDGQDDVLARVAAFGESIGEPYAVIGESRGSLIAHGLAMTRPQAISGICLIVPGGNDATSSKPGHVTLAPDPATAETLSPEVRARFDRLVVQSPDIARRIAATKVPAARMADTETARRVAAHFHPDLGENPEPFTGPALIVAGRQDAVAGWKDAAALQDAYPRSTFSVLDTAGHSLTWERPALFAALLRDWLDRLSLALGQP